MARLVYRDRERRRKKPIRVPLMPREAEEAAITRFLAETGATPVASVAPEVEDARRPKQAHYVSPTEALRISPAWRE